MVKLRLQRLGKNKAPYYRVVATDSRNPRDGRFIELIGTYHPNAKEQEIQIDEDKALKWLNNGAQPTDTVKSLFKKTGVYAKFVK